MTDHKAEISYLKEIFPTLGDVTWRDGSQACRLMRVGDWWGKVTRRLQETGSHWRGEKQRISDFEALAIVKQWFEYGVEKKWRDVYLGSVDGKHHIKCFNWKTVNGVSISHENTSHLGAHRLEALYKAWKEVQ